MAFTSPTNWDVRTTGSAGNGGGFDPTLGGTNYAMQNSPQVSYTDLASDAVFNTEMTSAAHPFTAAHVGNIVNITAGVTWSVQRVQILGVTSGTATCDKSLGGVGLTGGTGVLGGGLLTIQAAYGTAVASNTINVQGNGTGTFTYTSAVDAANTALTPLTWIGYGTAWSDTGSKPTITTPTNSVDFYHTGTSGGIFSFKNIKFTNSAATKGNWYTSNGGGNAVSVLIEDCNILSYGTGIYADFNVDWSIQNLILRRTEIGTCTIGVINSIDTIFDRCYIHNCSGDGVTTGPRIFSNVLSAYRTVFATNSRGMTALVTGGNQCNLIAIDCVFSSHTGDAIFNAGTITNTAGGYLQALGNIFWKNGGWGVHVTGASYSVVDYNAYGSNSSGTTTNVMVDEHGVTLTASPWTSASDFSLNASAGGGASVKGIAYPVIYSTATSFEDTNAMQSGGGGGGGGVILGDMSAGMRG